MGQWWMESIHAYLNHPKYMKNKVEVLHRDEVPFLRLTHGITWLSLVMKLVHTA